MDMEKGFGIPPQTISRIQMNYTRRHEIELVPEARCVMTA